MKATKSIGAIALSTALALGCAVPAFAAPDGPDADGNYNPVVEWDEDENGDKIPQTIVDGADGASETPVYIDVKKSNINVAVPIELRLVAETAGGDLLCPSDGVYGVENFSMNTAVYVNKVEVVYNEDVNADGVNWELVTDATQVGSGVEAANAKLGNLMVTLAAPDAAGAADSYLLDVANPKVPTAANAWRIEKSGYQSDGGTQTPTGKMFPLNFTAGACQSSIVQDADAANLMSQGDGEKAAANAIKLKYTISTAKPKA